MTITTDFCRLTVTAVAVYVQRRGVADERDSGGRERLVPAQCDERCAPHAQRVHAQDDGDGRVKYAKRHCGRHVIADPVHQPTHLQPEQTVVFDGPGAESEIYVPVQVLLIYIITYWYSTKKSE